MKPDQHSQDDAFVARAKQVLEHSVAKLDHGTVLRLQRARMTALSAGSAPRRRWVWASSLAMAAVAALAVLLWATQPAQNQHHALLLEDMELVMSADNVELAEDFEFYHWLADADQTG